MNKKSFGELFRYIRKQRMISQEEIARGICSTRTVFNIEKGIHIPSVEMMYHFAIKMGIDLVSLISYCNTANGVTYFKAFEKMKSCYEQDDYRTLEEETNRAIEEFHELSPHQQQTLNWYKGLCLSFNENKYSEAREYLLSAFLLTRDLLPETAIGQYCTEQELHIFNSYAMTFGYENCFVKADKLYSLLIVNIEKYGVLHNNSLYLKVCYNLAKCKNKLRNAEEALLICEKAIGIAREHFIMNSLAEIYLEIGNSYEQLGNKEERNKAYARFIYLYELNGNDIKVEEKKKIMFEKYGISFYDI